MSEPSHQHQRKNDRIGVLLMISNLEYGGAQRQIVELVNHLPGDRFDVHIASLSDYVPLADELRDRSRLHVIRKKHKFDVSVVPRVARLLRALRSDIVHGFLFDAEIAARLAGRLAGTPVVMGSERNTDYKFKARQRWAFRLTKRFVDVIVANSHAGAAFNRRMLGHDVSQYRVVHNGVDLERFAPQGATDIRRELGIGQDELVVGMFASFKARKNHPLLLSAVKRIVERVPTLRLLFVGEELYGGMHGSDVYRQHIDRLVDELGLRGRCLFIGNRGDVERLYPACEVTVLPSLHEGTPNVLLESMACGVPVIATDVSDNARVVPDGQAGFIVPLDDPATLADRIVRLLTNEAERVRMGHEARAWVGREFSTARLAARFTDVYEGALRTRGDGCNIALADG